MQRCLNLLYLVNQLMVCQYGVARETNNPLFSKSVALIYNTLFTKSREKCNFDTNGTP